MRDGQPEPDRRKAAARWIALVVVSAGLIGLGLWIALGSPGVGDDAEQPPDAAIVGADTPAAAVDTYLAGLAAGDFDTLLSVLADPGFLVRTRHDWWFDLLERATVDFSAEPVQLFGPVASVSFVANLRFITGDVELYRHR